MLTLIPFISEAKTTPLDSDEDPQPTSVDTTKVVFFLNGERIFATTLYKMFMEGLDAPGRGTNRSKDAIRLYGEKYRNGVIFYSTEGN